MSILLKGKRKVASILSSAIFYLFHKSYNIGQESLLAGIGSLYSFDSAPIYNRKHVRVRQSGDLRRSTKDAFAGSRLRASSPDR